MLRLLLDETIPKKVAILVKKQCPDIDIVSIHDWENGRFLGLSDEEILTASVHHGLTLVTYDQNTLLTHMERFSPTGIDHTGIVLIDERTIPQRDIGRHAQALGSLLASNSKSDWKNRTVHLRPEQT